MKLKNFLAFKQTALLVLDSNALGGTKKSHEHVACTCSMHYISTSLMLEEKGERERKGTKKVLLFNFVEFHELYSMLFCSAPYYLHPTVWRIEAFSGIEEKK